MNETSETFRILLIDDDPDDHLMFRDLLSQIKGRRYQVEWASSYDAGLKRLDEAFDVCFLDFRLGGHTGIELLRAAIAKGCKTPITLLTGYGEPEVDLEAMREGAADYLVKDEVTPQLLERSIRYSVHRAKSLQAILDQEAQIVVQDRLASVGMLASSLAHEIGTPLGVIRGRAEYLAMTLGNNPEATKATTIIISQIDRVSKLIRSLLNLARGEIRKPVEPVSPKVILEELAELMGHELRKQNIALHNDLPESLSVLAEVGPLHQVLLNLLVNSVHAIEAVPKEKQKERMIRAYAKERGKFWAITLTDTGCGISEGNLKKLFQPFFTTKDIGKGTGLGLATSYRILESWNGKIEVQSRLGEGAEFTLVIPKANK